MNLFCDVIHRVLADSGLTGATVCVKSKLELPGYFRPTKRWDMLVVHEKRLIAAMEFKSQVGPSFGKNSNNRTEEALGTAKDLWTAHREGAFGRNAIPPWVGWVMLLEEAPKSVRSKRVAEPHFNAFPEFKNTSIAQRYELLLRRLVSEKLYTSAAFLMSKRDEGHQGLYTEPAKDLSMKVFLASLAGHIGVYLASR